MNNSVKKYIAEFFGTMTLVIIGCGSVVFCKNTMSNFEIAICFGLTLTALIYTIGNISGCHINPAVTIAMLVLKKIKKIDAFWYIVSQSFGAIAGSAFLYLISVVDLNFNVNDIKLGQNIFDDTNHYEYNLFIAFILEMFFTTFFIVTILGTTNQKNNSMAGIVIGITLIVIHIVGIPITGVSVNPARSLGPALFVGGKALSQLWVFIVAPMCGAIIGAGIWILIEMNRELNKHFNDLTEKNH